MAGKVFLVGAGPGEPGLLTVRGRQLLQEADTVVYDRLVSPALLKECRPGAELIFAGKGPSYEAMPQEEINRLLVEKASSGKRVVRLKGGDPFVFGRGGEEAGALVAAGLPYEVVPGVTSAVAAPDYAGIPLTYRGVASSFAVVSGRAGARPGSRLDWQALTAGVDTLVVLMGVAQLEDVSRRLLEGGCPADTPAAVISAATWPEQQVVVGTLGDIAPRAAAQGVRNPAVVVVGQVVALRERLAWFERRPLSGRRVLVTRSPGQATALSRLIEDLGGVAVGIPLIQIVPPADWTDVDEALARLGTYQWVVFTSPNGVEFFFNRLRERGGDARALAGARVACVGEATAASLATAGIRADLIPADFRAEALLPLLAADARPGERVLLPRGDLAGEDLPRGLAAAGLVVEELAIYRNLPSAEGAGELRQRLEAGSLDAVTFASSSSVDNLCAALGPDTPDLLKDVVVACIGPVTAATARQRGLPVQVVAAKSTVPGLADSLAAYFATPAAPAS